MKALIGELRASMAAYNEAVGPEGQLWRAAQGLVNMGTQIEYVSPRSAIALLAKWLSKPRDGDLCADWRHPLSLPRSNTLSIEPGPSRAPITPAYDALVKYRQALEDALGKIVSGEGLAGLVLDSIGGSGADDTPCS